MYNLVSLSLKAEVLGSLHERFALQTFDGVNFELENLFRVCVRNILNGHAASWAVDEGWAASFSVKCERQVHFLGNANLLDDVDASARETSLATLLGDQSLADHLLGDLADLLCRINNVHTASEAGFLEVSKSTTTSEHLCLDDISRGLERLSQLLGFVRAKRHMANRDRHLI